ncbi:MAG: hypothetical protein EXS31_17270 [Pedosphaera sp.]|nr:hypothetical protein [Pedosphaera sp.]
MREFIYRWSLLLFLSIAFKLAAADLRLSVASLDESRRPTLLLSGLGSGQYGLEASTNLLQWFSLISSPGSGGELRYLHADATRFGALYYRGVKLPDITPLARIVPQVDSNYVAVGVVTYQEGGRLSLTNEGGTRYTFTVAPSNVLQSVAITMQLVTNLVSFPYANEMRSAVQFQPDGFQFHGAGLLEIHYPTNVPHLKLSSYAFNGEGGNFHLVPDRVATNSVRIPVTHFSVFGTAVWAPTERTRAFEAHADNVLDGYQHRAAEILGLERERKGEGNDGLKEVVKAADDFYKSVLEPQFAAAQADCSLFLSLTPRVLGHERQIQLLVGGDTPFLSHPTVQKAMCNCLNDLIFACEDASISAESFMERMLGIGRQSALLGLTPQDLSEDCGTGSIQEWLSDAKNKKLPCMTKWIGTISYSETGTFSKQSNGTLSGDGSSTTTTESMSVQYSFEGGVERVELEDDSIPGFFSSETWDLFFFPDASGAYSYKTETEKKFVCKSEFGVQQEDLKTSIDGASSGSNEVKVYFVFEDGKLKAFTILQRKGLKIEIPVTTKGTLTDCPKKNRVTDAIEQQSPITIFDESSKSSYTFETPFVPTGQVVLSKVSTTELVGTATGFRQDLVMGALVSIPYTWKFSLGRRPD